VEVRGQREFQRVAALLDPFQQSWRVLLRPGGVDEHGAAIVNDNQPVGRKRPETGQILVCGVHPYTVREGDDFKLARCPCQLSKPKQKHYQPHSAWPSPTPRKKP
jgi:hypothetical protein